MLKFLSKIKNFFPGKKKKSEKDFFSSFIRTIIYLIIFLMPLFFLPLNADPFELGKNLLFYLLVLIGMVAWFIQIVVRKEFDFVHTPFNWPVAAFGLTYLLTAIFSVNRYNSFWGLSGHFSESLLATFFFICFFFLVVNNLKSSREAIKALMFFIISLAVLMIFNFCQIFGLDILARLGWPGAPLFNLLSGSLSVLTVFLSAGAPLLFVLLMLARKSLDRIVLTVLLAIDLALIFIIADPVGIVSLIFGLFALLFFIAWRVQKFSSAWLISAVILIALSLVFLFLPLDRLLNLNFPADIQLDGRTSWQIVKGALADHLFFGVGPQNFYHAFAKYRPAVFNQSTFWDLDFVSAGSFWFNQWAVLGLLGGLIWLLLVLKYFLSSVWLLMKERQVGADWFLSIGVLAGWLVILAAGFFLPFNFIMTFSFWFWLALGVIIIYQDKNKIRHFSFAESGLMAFLSSLILIVLLVVGIGFLYFGAKIVIGEIYFAKASLVSAYDLPASQNAQEAKDNLQQIKDLLNKAIGANANQARYYLSLSQTINREMSLNNQLTELQTLAADSLAKTDLSWRYARGLAGYYRAAGEVLWPLQQILPQANTELINIFKEIVALNPNHPYFHLTLGQTYFFGGQMMEQAAADSQADNSALADQTGQYFQQASAEIKKAAELKSDWAPAQYYLALVLEREGKKPEAAAALQKALSINANQPDAIYELGRLYKDAGQTDEAVKLLERAIQLDAYQLGAYMDLIDIYESGGNKEKAIEVVGEALKAFPQNQELQSKLEALGKKK